MQSLRITQECQSLEDKLGCHGATNAILKAEAGLKEVKRWTGKLVYVYLSSKLRIVAKGCEGVDSIFSNCPHLFAGLQTQQQQLCFFRRNYNFVVSMAAKILVTAVICMYITMFML